VFWFVKTLYSVKIATSSSIELTIVLEFASILEGLEKEDKRIIVSNRVKKRNFIGQVGLVGCGLVWFFFQRDQIYHFINNIQK